MTHPKVVRVVSACIFWVTWPVSYLRLARSERTRVLVIAGGSKVLLLKSWHAPYKWTLPGGGIKPGEDIITSAARELYEETSVALGVENFQKLGKATFVDRGLKFRCHYYVATVSKPYHIQPNPPEVLEVRWVPLQEIENGDVAFGTDTAYAVTAWRKMVKYKDDLF